MIFISFFFFCLFAIFLFLLFLLYELFSFFRKIKANNIIITIKNMIKSQKIIKLYLDDLIFLFLFLFSLLLEEIRFLNSVFANIFFSY